MLVKCRNDNYEIRFSHGEKEKTYLEDGVEKTYNARVTFCIILLRLEDFVLENGDIFKNSKLIALGKTICDSRDRYNKAVGRIVALYYALKKIDDTSLKYCLFYNYLGFFLRTKAGRKNVTAVKVILRMKNYFEIFKNNPDAIRYENENAWKQFL